MPLNKATGNMFTWLTHTHTHLGGECPHKCPYCLVRSLCKKWPVLNQKYSGPVKIIEKELDVPYGEGKIIFVENLNDIACATDADARLILAHAGKYPKNHYVFQTKNPAWYLGFMNLIPDHSVLGCTIETNRFGWLKEHGCLAPEPIDRAMVMADIHRHFPKQKTFITVEPVMDFDVEVLAGFILAAKPDFLNLGADSKNNNLPEPSIEKIEALVAALAKGGIEPREKGNLERLRKT